MGCGNIIDAPQNSIVYSVDKLIQDISNHEINSNEKQQSSLFESVSKFESSIPSQNYQQSQGNSLQIDEKQLDFSRQKPNKSVTEINLDPQQRRIINTNHNYPYNCIVRLSFYKIVQNKSKEVSATGVVVSPYIILTSAHFIQAYRDCKGQCTKINAYLHGKCNINNIYEGHFQFFMPEYCNQLQLIQHDFGFVKLRRKIQLQRYICIALNFRFTNYPAQLCGFTVQNKQRKMKGIIKSWENEFIEYDIDSSYGQSGSPILIKIQSGQYYMISNHSGFYISFIQNDGKKLKFKKKQSQINKNIIKKQRKGEYQKDNFNSGCRIINRHKDFLIGQLKSHHHQFNEDIDLIIAQIKFIDLSEIPQIKFPKQYYSSRIESKQPKYVQGQRKEVKSIKIQRSKVTELQSNVISAIPINDDFHSSFNAAKKLYKQSNNHQSLIHCHKAFGNIKENNLLKIKCLDLIGSNLQALHNPHIAKIYYKKCVQLAQSVTQHDIMNSPDFLSIIKIIHNLGVMELEEENLEKAKKLFEKCQFCLFKKNKDKIEHYAAAQINLSLVLIKQNKEDPNNIIERLKASIVILQSVSNEKNNQIIGKIQAIRNILMILFQRGQYEEWLEVILKHFDLIVQMKMEEGIRNIFDAKPVQSSHRKELHRVIYETTQPFEKHHYLSHFFVSWKQELLEQADKILDNYEIKGTFQLKFFFALREICKGLAGNVITVIRKKMEVLKTKKQVEKQN